MIIIYLLSVYSYAFTNYDSITTQQNLSTNSTNYIDKIDNISDYRHCIQVDQRKENKVIVGKKTVAKGSRTYVKQ